MTTKDRLINVVADVFNLPVSEISDSSSQDTIEKWDSLGLINLVSELETTFSVQFELADIAVMKNVAIIREILKDKGVDLE